MCAFNALKTAHGLKEGIEQRQKLSGVVPSHLGYIYSQMSTGGCLICPHSCTQITRKFKYENKTTNELGS